MTELVCMVYSGLGGVLMIGLLGAVTIAFFVSTYYYRRQWLRSEKRPPLVFFFDLLKMLTAGVVSSVVNYTFTAKVSLAANGITVRGKPLEGIGWYGAISVVDILAGTPLSIALGLLINESCKVLDKRLRRPSAWKDAVHQNIVYGKYSDEHNCASDYRDTAPPVSWVWWYSQVVTWTCACVMGEMMSGLIVLYSFLLVRSVWNPVAWMAVLISYWDVNCLLKQYMVVAFGRLVLSYLRLAVIDYFNTYKEPKHRKTTATMAPPAAIQH